MREHDLKCLQASFTLARNARQNGNHPFGALLADEHGQILLEAENTVLTARDCTAHAELNLVRAASAIYDRQFLEACSLYASTEPCPMCAGAIFWANIKRLVYGLSEADLYQIVGGESEEVLYLSCREIFAHGKKQIEVLGPLLEQQARDVHLGFWS